MTEQQPSGSNATRARKMVEDLQELFVQILEAVSTAHQEDQKFEPVHWLRDDGVHGGGTRMAVMDTAVFDRASINVSGVHYDDLPAKKLGSATALSCIVHPKHPAAPSMHMHISWTEMKAGGGGFRVMADLNPSHPCEDDKARFDDVIRKAAGKFADDGMAQGDRYFHIPALDRARGVSHFYLEGHSTGDFDQDLAFSQAFGESIVDAYCAIVADKLTATPPPTAEQQAQQLWYHSLYLFQVLTLDRGTTSGLLVHDQNDVGILGSLPSHVGVASLKTFRAKMPAVQQILLDELVTVLEQAPTDDHGSLVDNQTKQKLALAVRNHYTARPEGLAHQASGEVAATTVENHR